MERLLSACHQQKLVMKVPAVASQVLRLVAVEEIPREPLFERICNINVLRVHPQEVRFAITEVMLRLWWENDGISTQDRLTHAGLAQLTNEACTFLRPAVVRAHFYWLLKYPNNSTRKRGVR